jgi:Nif-specific regulatory protein
MDGPPKGRLVPLGEVEVSVGRDQANAVPIDDLAASRHHCVIRLSGERFQLTDLESRNGTFVNGVPVRQRLLEHNDQIRVGGSVFLFLRSVPAEVPRGGGAPDNAAVARSTVLLTSDHSIYLDAKKLAESLPSSPRIARGVQILLRMSRALQGAHTMEALQRELLELLFDAVPAEQGAILPCMGGGVDFDSAFARHRSDEASPSLCVNREVSEQVFKDRLAMLAEAGSRCLLAAPLVCFERVEGILYLEAGGKAFDQGHLDLVSAVGVLAGLAVHNLLGMENLRTENQRLQAEIHIEHDMVGESVELL